MRIRSAVSASWPAPGAENRKRGEIPEYNLYQASDGWIAVAALEPHFKSRLESALNIASIEEYRTVFAGQTVAYWKAWGEQMDLPIDRVNSWGAQP